MADARPALEDLRRQIDEYDDRLLEALTARAGVARYVTAAKQRAGITRTMQPGREARLMRRLVARAAGAGEEGFPVAVLARIWREIIGVTLRIETDFRAVASQNARTGAGRALWDVARDHLGTAIPLEAARSDRVALAHLAAGEVTVAVLPFPSLSEDGDDTPWWVEMASLPARDIDIVARLPFVRPSPEVKTDALMVARADFQETGDDRTLVALILAADQAAAMMADTQGPGGPTLLARAPYGGTVAETICLFDLPGFVTLEDPAVAGLARWGRLVRLGGYATPLVADGAGRTDARSGS